MLKWQRLSINYFFFNKYIYWFSYWHETMSIFPKSSKPFSVAKDKIYFCVGICKVWIFWRIWPLASSLKDSSNVAILSSLFNLKYGAPTGWLYYAVNLWRPCNDKKCGGPVTPRPLIVNKSSPYTSFPVSNYVWEPKYYDIFANGDGLYLYPCEDGKPCSSIRL